MQNSRVWQTVCKIVLLETDGDAFLYPFSENSHLEISVRFRAVRELLGPIRRLALVKLGSSSE